VIERRTTKSGYRYDVRLRGPDGVEQSHTCRTLKDAQRYEREQRSSLDKGSWIDPRLASLTFGDYSKRWMKERHDLRPRTVELYESLLKIHIRPTFTALPLGKITPGAVRSWNSALAQRHPVTAAKAYRLLRQILSTAVADEQIARNPCVVKGAGQESSPERPSISIPEVDALTEAMPVKLRVAVMLAAWCQLRAAEIRGLERRDIDLLHGTVRIERTVNHVANDGGRVEIGPPKTEAGIRTLAVPPHLLPSLKHHLEAHVRADPSAPLLAGKKGERLRPAVIQEAWNVARVSIGRPELHFHDLRHAGATWSAISGATTRELMARLGHASPAAALRYQHATEDRDTALASALSALVAPAAVLPISEAAAGYSRDTAESAAG
jgi:integrase